MTYGEVKSVENGKITIAAGTMKELGGTMVVDGGTYTYNGEGSPAVYCTADIAVKDATLTANGADCDFTAISQDMEGESDYTITVDCRHLRQRYNCFLV